MYYNKPYAYFGRVFGITKDIRLYDYSFALISYVTKPPPSGIIGHHGKSGPPGILQPPATKK
ncbi:MAG: hypothetical protein NZZ41_07255, partial [Candidatus Dojkabacteria bacterium]|nr:hypothetical protein [Candidatus Dojkabacteria bacterium]